MNKKILFLSLITASSSILAQDKFENLLHLYLKNSAGLEKAEFETKTSKEFLSRSKRHWLPRVYSGVQSFSTNDPTSIFFNHLGQRSIEQSDFVPNDLNNPDRESFTVLSVGANLELYSGGQGQNQQEMSGLLHESAKVNEKFIQAQEYAEFVYHYGYKSLLKTTINELGGVRSNINEIVSNYKVGKRSNPVGHSGLLGLKGIQLKLQGLISQYNSHNESELAWFSTYIGPRRDFSQIRVESLKSFSLDKFKIKNTEAKKISNRLLAQKLKVDSMDSMAEMEKARFTPHVGVFANYQNYAGDRDTQDASTIGVYVKWDLFNPDSYGKLSEAKYKALAAKANIREFEKKEQFVWQKLLEMQSTLEENLIILNNSQALLDEQLANMKRLFNTGMVNALQLTEVYNRRVDLIEKKYGLLNNYLTVTQQLYLLKN